MSPMLIAFSTAMLFACATFALAAYWRERYNFMRYYLIHEQGALSEVRKQCEKEKRLRQEAEEKLYKALNADTTPRLPLSQVQRFHDFGGTKVPVVALSVVTPSLRSPSVNRLSKRSI